MINILFAIIGLAGFVFYLYREKQGSQWDDAKRKRFDMVTAAVLILTSGAVLTASVLISNAEARRAQEAANQALREIWVSVKDRTDDSLIVPMTLDALRKQVEKAPDIVRAALGEVEFQKLTARLKQQEKLAPKK